MTDPASGKVYWRVPGDDNADGAYFVRIDDNDDDAQDSSTLAAALNSRIAAAEHQGGPPASAPRRTPDAPKAGTGAPC